VRDNYTGFSIFIKISNKETHDPICILRVPMKQFFKKMLKRKDIDPKMPKKARPLNTEGFKIS